MNLSLELVTTRVRQTLTWLGWPGVSGLVLLLSAWVLHGVWLPGLQAEHDEAQSQVELLRHQLQSQAQAARALFAHVGGDLGDSIGWRAGLR